MSRRYFVQVGQGERAVDVERLDDGRYRVHVAGDSTPRDLTVLRTGPHAAVLAERRVLGLYGLSPRDLVVGRERTRVSVAERRVNSARAGTAGAGDTVVRAPMPGRVLELSVAAGQTVERGQRLIVVEAMKMENEVLAERAGTVKRVHVNQGDTVERNAVLVELD